MDTYDDVVNGRRSIRGFTSEPVARELIEEIIALAVRSPSSLNSQPWNFTVVTGEPLERIREGNTERMLAGVPESREFRMGEPYSGQHRERLGNDIAVFDCGAVTNALVNAAWSRGLGCVINSQGIMQSPVVREHAGIPDDQVIQTCVAMGWPEESFPANGVVSRRRSVAEAARFVGFHD